MSESTWKFELPRDEHGRVLLGDGMTVLSKELSDKLDKGELKFEPVFLHGKLVELSLVPPRNE